MSKKKSHTLKEANKSSRMYPSLHQEVTNAVSKHISLLVFHAEDSAEGVNEEYSTYARGVFRCYNANCSTRSWSSGKVTLLIRKYRDGTYNAVVFKQRCEECKRLGKLKLDETSYTDRVTYRLLKWAGVAQAQPYHGSKTTPPHKSHLCEGCKRGVCRES
ncbi:hypothetical protein IAQ61_003029 [Plenodomus lingam]|uniref:3CxxC-type domain-containing protein n=1 Tax=Leptosphaeria maculans (strain JN3 / isolate v23.1.3 / race Av1-4-5-6-7-8) TaxID=985895 RepID=E5ADC5_LEPMJ|nr:hypothetical protein LEMA_P000010.1 [Plenodomus lingam JN3]KAH9875565.1 hypothetical protein IAQ61_003029 [Plenodomus lingam]CBY01214.1 hypothetical protein LEMA_P000010.1 [Plenodomus lingam JN3]